MDRKFPKKFQGVAIGNGFYDQDIMTNSVLYYFYGHGLLAPSVWQRITLNCCDNLADPKKNPNETHCDFMHSKNPACELSRNGSKGFRELVEDILDGHQQIKLNPYNIYDQCAVKSNGSKVPSEGILTYFDLESNEEFYSER